MQFQFKKFVLQQSDQVFKFGTDAALLATWTEIENSTNILEVGTGTGVITLMMSQRNPKNTYTAIDISKYAIELANENLRNFPMESNITLIHSAIQDLEIDQKFDLVVSNPPFFENSTKSPTELKNTTRHTEVLPLKDLLFCAKNLLSDTGRIEMIYPSRYLQELKSISQEIGLFVNKVVYTRSTPNKPIKRVLVSISKVYDLQESTEMIINGEHKGYSKQVFDMLRPFLLQL